ncbi:sugar transferase [Sphingomonas sp.]|uniref:sugar transferase n=1 Tax=Sphingomonas sp. TaxID=28214 RepID=UPI00286A5E62|nr:sugar transferase [Sphingomonas sp.]
MLQNVPLKSTGQLPFVLRRRFEFAGALALAALVPWAGSRWLISDTSFDPSVFHNALIANVLAICLALWIRISVSTYPGIRAGQVVIPAVFVAHATMLALLVLSRVPYHRPSLALGFGLHLVWAFAIYFFVSRRLRPRIAIVPVGAVDLLKPIDTVDWRVLRAPELHRVRDCHAIVADFADLPDEWEAFLADAAIEGRMVYQVQQLFESLTGRVQVRHISENSFGSLVPARAYSAIKHLVDWLAVVALLPVLVPLLGATALAIKLFDGGPVLFRQRRTGRGGKQFWVTKFRTMKVAGEIEDHRLAAMTDADDVRITRLGALLRRSRIDELPQVWNILRGEMSWIGPRPEAQVLSTWYTGDIPFYRYRHVVRPGISGWAQVNQGHVAEVDDIHLKLQYDFFYIKYFSPWLDILIVFRTVRTMLTGFGSK